MKRSPVLWTIILVLGIFNAFVSGDGMTLRIHMPDNILIAAFEFLAPGCIVLGLWALIDQQRKPI